MTTLGQLAAGLDAVDDFVRLRMRQALADLKSRQEQIDRSLDQPPETPGAEPRTPVTATATRRDTGDDDEQPATWLV